MARIESTTSEPFAATVRREAPPEIDDGPPPRVAGRLVGGSPGPTLICVAGIHGNEPSGVRALERVFDRMAGSTRGLRGEFLGLIGNRLALARERRYLGEDLNRLWRRRRLNELSDRASAEGEEREARELIDELRAALARARGPLLVLDLHSTSAPGPPFVVLDDSLDNRSFAREFPAPLVLGLEEELAGTLTAYLTSRGHTAIGFEAGQHLDPRSPGRAEAAVWIALEASGVLRPGERREPAAARRLLKAETLDLPAIVEVRHRHPVEAGSGFAMLPGFSSFERVTAEQPLARDREGEILAGQESLLLMPLYQEQGEDGFFLVHPVHSLWLALSSALRRLKLERFLHWLPGVRRHPEREGDFLVDLRWARWLATELFHLLGLERRGREGDLVWMSRRSSDEPRPVGPGEQRPARPTIDAST